MTRVLDGIDAFLDQLGSVELVPLLLAVTCHLLKMACTSRAWRNVLAAAYPDERVRWSPIYAAYLAGVGVNAIVPARAGDAVRIYLAHRAVPQSSYTTVISSKLVLPLFAFTAAGVTVVIKGRTADSLGWINTYQGLIVPSLASTFGVFLVRQVFLQLPGELREAASLDGVGHLRFLWEVAAPLSRPTLGALGLFTFLGTWNAYLWPSQVIRGDRAHETIQIGLERLKNSDISKVNLVTGGLVVAALPIFVMLVVFQRQLVRGLTAGAVKG